MISLFRRNSTDTTAAARALYATIVDQSRQPGFFTLWGIPDTPNGRFEVLVLHVFLVMHRMRDDADCAKLARSLSEQAVLDVDRNLREMGIGDLSVGRKVKSLTEGPYGRLGVYAEGSSVPTAASMQSSAEIYFRKGKPSDASVQAAESYMRRETESQKHAIRQTCWPDASDSARGQQRVLKMAENNGVEFSRPQPIDEIGRDGLRVKLTADSSECAALAKRFDIIGVSGLEAELQLRQVRGGDIIAVAGTLAAEVEQECVVSLEPVASKISETIDERFARNAEIADEILVSVDEPEEIDDLVVGDEIDLGEMLAQCLYLALDPYPRKEGVEISESVEAASQDVASNPFSVLENLKTKEKH